MLEGTRLTTVLKSLARTASFVPSSLAWTAVGTLTAVVAVLVWVPWRPRQPDSTLDPSWAYALHLARAAGRRFGDDIVFTYGPTGFVYTRMYHPATFEWMVAGWVVLALAFAVAGTWLARWQIPQPARAALWLLVIVVVAAVEVEALVMLPPLLLLVTHLPSAPRLAPDVRVLLVLASAIVALMKFPMFLATVSVIGILGLEASLVRRRVPRVTIDFAIAIVWVWLLAQPSLSNLRRYLVTAWEVAATYNQGMQVTGPALELLAGAVLAAAIVALLASTELRVEGWGAIPSLMALTALVALVFRAGFVRHDGVHVVRAGLTFLLFALVLAPRWWGAGSWVRAGGMIAVLGAAAFATSMSQVHYGDGLHRQVGKVVSQLPEQVRSARHVLSGTDDLAAAGIERMRTQREAYRLPPVAAPADIFPYEITALAAYGIPYAPRPILQSYAAHSPMLAEINAAHLRGSGAPAGVLLRFGASDRHYPPMDDGRWWLELLSRYHITGFADGFLAWERLADARGPKLESGATVEGRLGMRLALPNAGGVATWAVFGIRPNRLGAVLETLLKLPTVDLEVETRDGERVNYRLPRAMAEAGFLLSPLLRASFDVAALSEEGGARGRLRGREVVAVRVLPTAAGQWLYHPTFQVLLSRVELPRRPLPEEPALQTLRSRLDLAGGAPPPTRLMMTPAGEELIGAHAPAAHELPWAATARRLRLEFGIMDRAWRDGNGDGVDFAAVAVGRDGGTTTLWARTLDPRARLEDRGPQRAEFDVPSGTVRVRLETKPRATIDWDWSYWSEALAQ